jgi:hypothetical protein
VTIIADEKDARLPIDARASLIVLANQSRGSRRPLTMRSMTEVLEVISRQVEGRVSAAIKIVDEAVA